MSHDQQPLVSIGMPVYNSEKTIEMALNSLTKQIYKKINIYVSDNNSTDNTVSIIKKIIKNNKNIKLTQQKQNIGSRANFAFVLKQAKGKYFMFAGSDDTWYPDFVKKNVAALENNPQYASSISKVNMPDMKISESRVLGTLALKGSYIKRLRSFLLFPGANSRFYGLFNTNTLQQSFEPNGFIAEDWTTIIKALKHGEFNQLDEVLMHRSAGGASRNSISLLNHYKINVFNRLFPLKDFTIWVWKNIAKKDFLMCIDLIIFLNILFSLHIINNQILKLFKINPVSMSKIK